MSVSVDETEEPGWEVDPEDESGAAVVAAVGRQIRKWRESKGLRAAELGERIGYGEDLIRKVERGARIPRTEFLDKVDDALGAGGLIAVMKADVAEVRYPKKVRDLARLEARAVEIGGYESNYVHGLLQTPDYARALFEMRQPAYSQEEVERNLAARMARRAVYDRSPAPALSFVLEEATLRRPIGGTMVWRQQLQYLLEVCQLHRSIALQVMPTHVDAHASMDGRIEMLKFGDGTAVGRSPGAFNGRPVSDLKQLRILELRYGMIRAQALTPRESLVFIEHVLGET
ncbi:helix-turn-helix transcriptional regulator [Streptomyces sp. NPDC056222]|uniref:helix-turn-helix domain-containing protein n=1 Tax=Streptomyces sp. NPDC056222 TaxID=3345749 RepID=UPI0035D9CF74